MPDPAIVKCYVTIWEFHVRARHEIQFQNIYGPNGEWGQLFAKAEGFIRTELNRDVNDPLRYVTLDYWRSKEAYQSFRQQFQAEYLKIDHRCERLTDKEEQVGEFQIVD